MSNSAEKRTTGGWDGAFHTTHWTEIFEARSWDEPRRREAMERLLATYWKPVYCFLRRKGYDREEAKDFTQSFLHEVVLGRRLIHRADRAKGRFRTFLIRALERYMTSVHRADVAKRRTPEGGFVRLDGAESLEIPELAHYATPAEVFDYAWASALLDQVLAEVASQCQRQSKGTHWDVFQVRVLLPITENAECASLADVCQKYGIPSRSTVSKMTVAVKRRFRTVLRSQVRQLVDSEAEVDDEIRHFMRAFSLGAASWGRVS